MEQEKEKNEETFVKKVVQTALEAERQIRRQQVLHNTRMLMEEYIEMKRHIESAVSEEEELKEEQYDVWSLVEYSFKLQFNVLEISQLFFDKVKDAPETELIDLLNKRV